MQDEPYQRSIVPIRRIFRCNCITPGPTQYIYTSDAYPGRIYKLTLDGKLLGVLGKAGRQMKQFGWIHEIACPSENELYVGELLNWRMQKLILHPAK